MKKPILLILVFQIFVLIFSSGCMKEAEREFPRVKTLPVKIIDNGAILKGEISNFRSLDIEEYGFLIGEGSLNENSEFYLDSLGSELGSSTFEHVLTTGLEVDKSYFYRAYAISNNILSIGDDFTFISRGCDPPVITGFLSTVVKVGEDLIIYGENFSPIAALNQVSIGSSILIPESVSNTQLRVRIGPGISEGNYIVGVKTCSEFIYASELINIPVPLWIRIADFPGGEIYKTGAFTIDGLGYVGLGRKILGEIYPRNFWQYDPLGNTWTAIANFPGPTRVIPVASSINGNGYVGGGFDRDASGKQALSDFYSYDPYSDSWQYLTNNPAPRNSLYVGIHEVINDKLYVSAEESSLYSLAVEPPVWSNVAGNIPDIYSNGSSFVIDEKLYWIAGIHSETGLINNGLWVYDPSTMFWEQKNDFPGPARYGAIGFSIGDKGYFGFGYDKSQYLKDVWEYDPINDTWLKLNDYPGEPRYGSFVFIIGNSAYIGTGVTTGAVFKKDVFRFTPSN